MLLPGTTLQWPGSRPLNHYTVTLFGELGVSVAAAGAPGAEPDHPAALWARSGMMALTGGRAAPPVMCPVPLATCADGALDAFRALTGAPIFPGTEGSHLLAERAAYTGHRRNGAHSQNGHCRLLSTRDGTVGVNLARHEDWELLPALFETAPVESWSDVKRRVEISSTQALVSRSRLLGLAIVDAESIPEAPCRWMDIAHGRARKDGGDTGRRGLLPRVVDLSSLWAGPLCSSLWQAAGADVIKVESSRRPDGARYGSRAFFALLNEGKHCVSLDLHEPAGQGELRELIKQADIVLEGSRPRALRQMGIVAEDLIAACPHLTWVSISGYGRGEPRENWIAYGDDAGIAAGLSKILYRASGEWLICGDAVADPMTGMHAALAGWASWLGGGGHLIDLSLEQTVRHCITATAPADRDYRARQLQWEQYLCDQSVAILPPQRRKGVQASPR